VGSDRHSARDPERSNLSLYVLAEAHNSLIQVKFAVIAQSILKDWVFVSLKTCMIDLVEKILTKNLHKLSVIFTAFLK